MLALLAGLVLPPGLGLTVCVPCLPISLQHLRPEPLLQVPLVMSVCVGSQALGFLPCAVLRGLCVHGRAPSVSELMPAPEAGGGFFLSLWTIALYLTFAVLQDSLQLNQTDLTTH